MPRRFSREQRRRHQRESAGLVDGCDLVAQAGNAARGDVSARRPPRWTSGRRSPGRASFSRWAHGSASRRPTHSTGAIRNRRPTRPLREIPTGDDVAARLLPGELGLVEHLGLDECELVPAAGSAEGSATVRVAVAGRVPDRRAPRPRRRGREVSRRRGRTASGVRVRDERVTGWKAGGRLSRGRQQTPPIYRMLPTGATGLEPATSGVTGRRSNQLNYAPEPAHCIGGPPHVAPR
jgi:hypothetical protein